jgi:hypothetical protein
METSSITLWILKVPLAKEYWKFHPDPGSDFHFYDYARSVLGQPQSQIIAINKYCSGKKQLI